LKGILFIVQDIDIIYKFKTLFFANVIKKNISNVSIKVISPISKGKRRIVEKYNGIEIYRYPKYEAFKFWGYFVEYPISFLFTFLYFLCFLLTNSFNVLHLTLQPGYYVLIVLLAKIFNKKIITDIIDFGDDLFNVRFGNMQKVESLLLSFDKVVCRNSNLIFVHTKYYTKKIKEIFKLKKEVIEYYGTINDIHPIVTYPEKIVILNRAMLKRHDGIPEFLQIAKTFFNKYPDIDAIFMIIGYGELYDAARKYIQDHNLSEKVIIIEFIAERNVYYKIIASATICVGTDIDTPFNQTSLSFKYIEYFWARKPVIAWELWILKEYLGDYIYLIKNGDINAFAEAIYQFIIDENLRKKYSELSEKAFSILFSEEAQKERIIKPIFKLLYQ
jgi:glycosyltransferase involved in cell wall biosynthesis